MTFEKPTAPLPTELESRSIVQPIAVGPSIPQIATGVFLGVWLFVLSAAALGFSGLVAFLYLTRQS